MLMWFQLEAGFQSGLTEAMHVYNSDTEKKNAMNGLQEGVSGIASNT